MAVKITKKEKARALAGNIRRICVELKLKSKQLDFCREFIIDYNIQKASKRAGYTPAHGYKLLEEQQIISAIKYLQSIDSAYDGINELSLAGQMAIWSRSDIGNYYENGWTKLKEPGDLSTEERSCIKSVSVTYSTDGTCIFKLDLYDKMRANENLSKVYKIYESPKNDEDIFDDMTEEQIKEYINEHE